ncbi:MAG: A/G-specific adenine glycosylase [Rhodothermales bacterium]|jgi:A/G-specific adenine glycosylase
MPDHSFTPSFRWPDLAGKEFSERLLAWWDVHGRKNLPWQDPRTPYRVWVSEIMLQQTQVTTVVPYFERFMQHFPDLATLASSSMDEVLSLWAGLGYYARGRNLHKTAGIIMRDFDGKFPGSSAELARLPGIGESTANAIISQAWDIPATVVDGNVRRVLARHDVIDGWPGKKEVQIVFWQAAEQRLPSDRGADYTQAIMDLGATLCTRRKPRCIDCPVSNDCMAYLSDTTDLYPAKRPKIKITEKHMHMLIISNGNDQILLERRPPAGIWGGLWSLPEDEDEQALANRFGLDSEMFFKMPDLDHRLTHMKIYIKPRAIRSTPVAKRVESSSDQRWFGAKEWSKAGLPKPVLILLKQHQQEYTNDTNG